MRSLSRFPRSALLFLAGAACAGSAGDSASPGAGDDGGGGVSFGGAQDIGEFRSILDRGEIPGPSTLDANGFFNEHFAPPPPATCGGKLCITSGLSVGRAWLDDSHQATLQVAISTNVDPSTYTRLPMRLVVVVDHSGSMAQDGRLEKVKLGLGTLIDNLKDEDRLAILSFDDVVTVDAPFAQTLNRAALKTAVSQLQPRGGTNIHDGLKAGLDLLGDAPPSDRQNRVIFLSDGLATVGNTSTPAIIEMATSKITRGIGLTTIGVGNDFDAPLMRGLAERGAGNFYYVEDAAAAGEVFHDELDYFMSPLALELELKVTAAEGWEMRGAVGSSLWQSVARSGSMSIPAVFLASRTSQTPDPNGGRRGGGSMIFINLVATGASPGRVADLRLSYRLPGSTERVTDTAVLDYSADPNATPDEPHLSYAAMAERFAMYNMFLGLHAATQYAGASHDCAAAALSATRRAGKAWLVEHEADQDLAADLMLVEQFLANLAERGAQPDGSLAGCPKLGPDGWPEDQWGDDWGDDHVHYGMACSSSGGSAGWLVIGLAVVLAGARRRRRSS
ncbi:MAG TPA: VWA domain-containing protein [Kofleriaceae bacterium]|nr:VWA domain-containing protein [Kofleriaceae bacterium]